MLDRQYDPARYGSATVALFQQPVFEFVDDHAAACYVGAALCQRDDVVDQSLVDLGPVLEDVATLLSFVGGIIDFGSDTSINQNQIEGG